MAKTSEVNEETIPSHQLSTTTLQPISQLRKQKDYSIFDYTKEFHCLGVQNNLSESEHQLVSRFVLGLRDDIKEVDKLHPVAYAISLATTI